MLSRGWSGFRPTFSVMGGAGLDSLTGERMPGREDSAARPVGSPEILVPSPRSSRVEDSHSALT